MNGSTFSSFQIYDWIVSFSRQNINSGGFRGGRAGRAPPPKIRKAYVIQR